MYYAKMLKTGNFKMVSGDQNPEYALLTLREYENVRSNSERVDTLSQQLAEKESELQKLQTSANNCKKQLEKEKEAHRKAYVQLRLQEHLHTCCHDSMDLQAELREQAEALNQNLRRVCRERANATRGLTPKKQLDGYIVLKSDQALERVSLETLGEKKTFGQPSFRDIPIWRTTIQTPYDASIPYEVIQPEILRDLFGTGILKEMGCMQMQTEDKNGEFRIWKDSDGSPICGAYRWSFSANLRAGFWEILLYTTQALVIPAHRNPSNYQ